MSTHEEIIKQNQLLSRAEKTLALEKLKKRRADTRRKIELGGLVIKSGIDGFRKSVILGALMYTMKLMQDNSEFLLYLEKIGEHSFLLMD